MRTRHIRGGKKKNRIAEGEDELFRRAMWISGDVNECAAGEA